MLKITRVVTYLAYNAYAHNIAYANTNMHMQVIKWICILWSAYAYNPMHINKFICIKLNILWIDIRLSRLSFLIDFESYFSSSSLHSRVVEIAELVWDCERGTRLSSVNNESPPPTQPWSSPTSCSTVHISHTVQYSQRKFLPRSKSERKRALTLYKQHTPKMSTSLCGHRCPSFHPMAWVRSLR